MVPIAAPDTSDAWSEWLLHLGAGDGFVAFDSLQDPETDPMVDFDYEVAFTERAGLRSSISSFALWATKGW